MHVVVLHNWRAATPEHIQSLAKVLGVTAFDARQRLICDGPIVITTQADPRQADAIQQQLQESGFSAFIVDVSAALTKRPVFVVRSFSFEEDLVRVFDSDGRKGAIAYRDIKLILPTTRAVFKSGSRTVTERKFSLGKTLMAGGLPMTKKVEHQEAISKEERENTLYLCGGNRARLVCSQDKMAYEGFRGEMKSTTTMNFNLFVSRIRERSPGAVYDERLMKHAEQVKLLGPLLAPESHLDLAVDIFATSVAMGDKSN